MAVDTSKWADYEAAETDATGDTYFVLPVASASAPKDRAESAEVAAPTAVGSGRRRRVVLEHASEGLPAEDLIRPLRRVVQVGPHPDQRLVLLPLVRPRIGVMADVTSSSSHGGEPPIEQAP